MRTVKDFQKFMMREHGDSLGLFVRKSEAHLAFWKKLNDMGARNIKAQPPERVPNIDATVQLTDEEWSQLEAEFRQLLK